MSKKRGLGRGMDALLKTNDSAIKEAVKNAEKNGILEVSLLKIKPNPDQPRKIFKDDEIRELAETIKENGLINPLTLRDKGDHYQIISGERRFRALKYLKMEKANALVLDVSDEKMLEITLVENIQRSDLNAVEIAESYKKLIDIFNIRHEDLAHRVGRSRSAITNSMRILDLSSSIRQMIINEKLSEGHARVLLSVGDLKEREKLAKETVENKYSVRDLERLVKGEKIEKTDKIEAAKIQSKESHKTEIKSKDPNIKKIENELEKIFATKVSVQDKNGKEGRIVIEYYSADDFSRIIEIIEESIRKSNGKEVKIIEY